MRILLEEVGKCNLEEKSVVSDLAHFMFHSFTGAVRSVSGWMNVCQSHVGMLQYAVSFCLNMPVVMLLSHAVSLSILLTNCNCILKQTKKRYVIANCAMIIAVPRDVCCFWAVFESLRLGILYVHLPLAFAANV